MHLVHSVLPVNFLPKAERIEVQLTNQEEQDLSKQVLHTYNIVVHLLSTEILVGRHSWLRMSGLLQVKILELPFNAPDSGTTLVLLSDEQSSVPFVN